MDLLDTFAAKYKFPKKSHHWYIYIFWHTIILAVINTWLLYKRDCGALMMTKKEILKRRSCNLSHPGEHTQDNTQERVTIFREDEHIHTEGDIREHFGSSEETILNRCESPSQEVIGPPPK
ncbi:piggyBac transposable element-derived protein 3-like [Tachysurus ichikawai]